jgi:hypothetical protein
MQKQFLEGQYIIILKPAGSPSFPENFIYRQRENYEYLRVEKDLEGDLNGTPRINPEYTEEWRYATPHEIEEYKRLGKPFNVTSIDIPDISTSYYEIY